MSPIKIFIITSSLISLCTLVILTCLIGYKFIYKRRKLLLQTQIPTEINFSNRIIIIKNATSILSINRKIFSYQFKTSRHVSIDFRNFRIEESIGKGSYGTVYKCSLPPSFEKNYAVKHIECENVSLKFRFEI